MSKIRTSEVFRSFQGEGRWTGVSTIWVRLFGCNLECKGFFQKDPTNPSTYVLPHEQIDVKQYKKMSDLPVFEYGCDSSYSWSHRFKKLATDFTPDTLAEQIAGMIPGGAWVHPLTNNTSHLCFTGGEPMMQQKAIVATLLALERYGEDMAPHNIQIETNCTKPIVPEFWDYFHENVMTNLSFNMSPKLFNTTGELPAKAWDPAVIESYLRLGRLNCLKFVVTGTQQCWDELDGRMKDIHDLLTSFDCPVYIMPVGATKEQQEAPSIAEICDEAMSRGYHISTRAHVYVYGNKMGS